MYLNNINRNNNQKSTYPDLNSARNQYHILKKYSFQYSVVYVHFQMTKKHQRLKISICIRLTIWKGLNVSFSKHWMILLDTWAYPTGASGLLSSKERNWKSYRVQKLNVKLKDKPKVRNLKKMGLSTLITLFVKILTHKHFVLWKVIKVISECTNIMHYEQNFIRYISR